MEVTRDPTPMGKRPIPELALRWLMIATVVFVYVLTVRPIKGLGSLAAGKKWTRNDADAAFTDQMLGMALGWSLNPLLEACFKFVFNLPFDDMGTQIYAAVGYAVAVSVFALTLFRFLFPPKPEDLDDKKDKASSQTDAGYDDGGGGD